MRLGCRCAHTRAPSHPRNTARTARLLTVAALQADILSRSSQAVALQYLPRAVARMHGCRQISPGQPSSLSGTDQLVQRQAAHMLCDEQLHVYRSDQTTEMLGPCSAAALPLLCRCCTATAAERCRRFKLTGRCRHAAASSLQQDTWADGDAPPKDQPQSAQEPSAHGPCSMPCALTVQHVPCVLTVCTADSYKHM